MEEEDYLGDMDRLNEKLVSDYVTMGQNLKKLSPEEKEKLMQAPGWGLETQNNSTTPKFNADGTPIRPTTPLPPTKYQKLLGSDSTPGSGPIQLSAEDQEIKPHLDAEVEALIVKNVRSTKAAQLLGQEQTVIDGLSQPHLDPQAEEQLLHQKVQYSKAARLLGEAEVLDDDDRRRFKVALRLGEAEAVAIDHQKSKGPEVDMEKSHLDNDVELLVLKSQVQSSKAATLLGEYETVIEAQAARVHLTPAEEKQVLNTKVQAGSKAARILGENPS